jgi:Arc/MetJ family transcription regulator
MPNKPKTKTKTIRIDEELWQAAIAKAATNDETVSDVVRRALGAYIGRQRIRQIEDYVDDEGQRWPRAVIEPY